MTVGTPVPCCCPLPPGVYDTFTAKCHDCGRTVQYTHGVMEAHDCTPSPEWTAYLKRLEEQSDRVWFNEQLRSGF